jgi:type I restriction enzyme S subunit
MKVVRVSDFKGDFAIDFAGAPLRAIDPRQQEKARLTAGDILVVKSSGSAENVVSGRVAVVPESVPENTGFSNFLLRLVARPELVLASFVVLMLGSPAVRRMVKGMVKTMTYPNLRWADYSLVPVPVPPLHEQYRAVSELGALREQVAMLEDLQSETSTELDALLPAILDRAFKGEL